MGRKRGDRLWIHPKLKISALPPLSGATLDTLLEYFSGPWLQFWIHCLSTSLGPGFLVGKMKMITFASRIMDIQLYNASYMLSTVPDT